MLLRVSAAYAFLNMQKAALEDGVRLVPIAGYHHKKIYIFITSETGNINPFYRFSSHDRFRSVSEQQEVYYGKKIEGGKKYAGRARVCLNFHLKLSNGLLNRFNFRFLDHLVSQNTTQAMPLI